MSRHSADVAITLLVGEKQFGVASCYNNVCVLSDPDTVPPTAATLVIRVDGQEWRKEIFLVDGICPTRSEVVYVCAGGAESEPLPF